MRNLSLASLLVLALSACGAGGADTSGAASAPPSSSPNPNPDPTPNPSPSPSPNPNPSPSPTPNPVPNPNPTPEPLQGLPAWVSGKGIGEWFQIPNTAISSVNPSPLPPGTNPGESKIIAWTSFVVDTRTSKVYSVANGGHRNYAGNEVDELTLEVAQPAWAQILAPTPNAQITDCTSYYGDGRPTSRHTYYGVTLNTLTNRIMLFGGAHWCSAGGFHTATSSYNIGSNTYNPSGTHPNFGVLGVAAYSVNPATGDVYSAHQFSYRRWNSSANTVTNLNASGSGPHGEETMSAMDTNRNQILYVGGLNNDHHLYTVSGTGANSFRPITLIGSSAASIASADKGGMFYVAAIDRYLVRLAGGGGTVYQINPANFEVTQFPTTGGSSIPLTDNGPYNKFLYVPRLGGAIYFPLFTGNAWFIRLHP